MASASQVLDDPTISERAEALFRAVAQSIAEAPPRAPGATYRIQVHKGFRFTDVLAITDYLDELGITDCYLSPFLQARPGSTHGYDVFDHSQLNPEICDENTDAQLAACRLGRVIDVVPNHMGIAGPNPYWQDVLETGPQARSAPYFDIDWYPVKDELTERVLLPILNDQYGKVLDAGDLVLDHDGGQLFIRYYDRQLPLAPKSYAMVLERGLDRLRARLQPDDASLQEYESILASSENLPGRENRDPDEIEAKRREKEVIKRRLKRLCDASRVVREVLDEAITSFCVTPENPEAIPLLHELLEQQIYRLAFWRVAADEINYRRFFDINDLAGIRVEDPVVFANVHQLIFKWVDRGVATCLRIDHPDGLADPRGYFERLQETFFLNACKRRFESEGDDPAEWEPIAQVLPDRYREETAADPASPLFRPFPVVVEKILSRGEELPSDWPVHGTVGYEYLNLLNGLFVDTAASEALSAIYAQFTGDREPFAEVLYESKRLIGRVSLASELNMLARQLSRVAESNRHSRDFTLNDLRRALHEVVACFPVYRSYLLPGQPISDQDRAWIEQAVARARWRNPASDPSVFAFIQETLLLQHPADAGPDQIAQREAFVKRFQQTTGAIQAKGLEDTAFYRQFRLVSLNEVGADPTRFGNSPSVFHAHNSLRLKQWPCSLATTATHDTKRGEDTRLRINVLSEIPDDWNIHLNRWAYWNSRRKTTRTDADPIPDAREEYLLYQNLLGAWPFETPEDSVSDSFLARVQEFMAKAVREAKRNTSWADPDPLYVNEVARFISEILSGPDAGPFLKDFRAFQGQIARVAIVHSLSQTLLKLTSPGTPDTYQGCELWDLSLVDPDNRRPVDYKVRKRILSEVRQRLEAGMTREALARSLFANPQDGAIKLYLIWTVLNHRRTYASLYQRGSYRPIETRGTLKNHVISFARKRDNQSVLIVGARLVARLMGPDGLTAPLGIAVWEDTHLALPDQSIPTRWRDLLTDRVVTVSDDQASPILAVGDLFETLPVALLVGEDTNTNL